MTRGSSPEEVYREWLRALADFPEPPLYDLLFDIAYATKFAYFVPNDANRATDGLDLRERFERESSITLPDLGECRIIEFLIALAIRMNNTVYDYAHPDKVPEYFWMFMEHLDLLRATSDIPGAGRWIIETFNVLMDRTYDEDGTNGGLFPLQNSLQDQRNVEIWYQMMAFLNENA